MDIRCQKCGASIHAQDVNMEHAIARCAACSAVFRFSDVVESQGEAAHRKQRIVEPPRGVAIEDWGPKLKFTRKWFTPAVFALLIFCGLWDGFLVFWYSQLGSLKDISDPIQLVVLIFPIGHVLVGLLLSYACVCMFVNRTVVEVGDGQLTIRHGPLPCPGNRTIDTASLDQLYCKQRQHRTQRSVYATYELFAKLKNGKSRKLIGGLEKADQARFLEQQIEQRLHIRDAAVAGEFA